MLIITATSCKFSKTTGQVAENDSTRIINGVTYKLADFPLYIDPVYNGPSDPTTCYNSQTGKWYMYYTSRRLNVDSLSGIRQIHGTPIGIAESSDGGATWKYIGDCNIDYKPDEFPTYWAPEVLEYEGLYHMYLSYVPGIFDISDCLMAYGVCGIKMRLRHTTLFGMLTVKIYISGR